MDRDHPHADRAAEILALADAYVQGNLSAEMAERLEHLVLHDAKARQWYVEYLQDSYHLHLLAAHALANEESDKGNDECGMVNDELGAQAGIHYSTFSIHHSPTIHYPLFTIPSSIGSILFSYLAATVIVGVGLLIGWAWKVSDQPQIARQSVPLPSPLSPLPSVVGRITGIVDCQWLENPKAESRNPKSLVSLGDKFTLSSGLMEITYDTGAKVILQGPVRYEVESKDGGFLSLGKLTARLEKKVASGQWSVASKSQNSNPQSLIPNPFVIRTPTAIVTDLGTEFGVEVDKGGNCEVHVLKGLVQTKFFGSAGRESQTVQLKEGEGRRYKYELGQVIAIPVNWTKFEQMRIVRPDDRQTRWLAYSRRLRKDPALVAYYTFESAGQTNALLPNVSAGGSELDAQVENAEWVYGRLPGKYALLFHGPGSGDKVVLPHQERFNFTGPFSAAVWFKVQRFTVKWQALVAKGGFSWRLQQYQDTSCLSFDSDFGVAPDPGNQIISHTNVADGRWHLAVAVYEPTTGGKAHKQLYVDGRLDAEGDLPPNLRQNDEPVLLGTNVWKPPPNREFQGLIDEVAIVARPLSAREAAEMFQAGNPAKTE